MDQLSIQRQKLSLDFDAIFNHYYPSLVLFALKLTGNREESEEIVQDVFIRFWIKESVLSINYSIKAFLFKSVFHASLDHLRKEAVLKKRKEQFFINYEDSVEFRDPILEEELDIAIRKAISELPAQCQKIFKLKRQQGLSYKEIASQLNISQRTVEVQISRAIKQLKKKLVPLLLIFH